MLLKGGPAGSGMKKPKTNKRPDWTCSQGHDNLGRWTRCMKTGCNEKRP